MLHYPRIVAPMNDFPQTVTNGAPLNEQAAPPQASEPQEQPAPAFLAPLKRDIDAQVGKIDGRLQELRDSISDVQRQIADLEKQRSTLLQMQRLASGKPAGSGRARSGGGESAGAGRQRLSPDQRRKQIADLIAAAPVGLKKAQIVEATGLSKIYVQNLLTEMRNAGKLQSQPSQTGDGSLVWRAA